MMPHMATIAVVGDWNPANQTHVATNTALDHVGVSYEWVPTEVCDGSAAERLRAHAGIFVAPASPYRSMGGPSRRFGSRASEACRSSVPEAASSMSRSSSRATFSGSETQITQRRAPTPRRWS
jgi:hypothetical protein